eukprot:Rmarinus@m.7191
MEHTKEDITSLIMGLLRISTATTVVGNKAMIREMRKATDNILQTARLILLVYRTTITEVNTQTSTHSLMDKPRDSTIHKVTLRSSTHHTNPNLKLSHSTSHISNHSNHSNHNNIISHIVNLTIPLSFSLPRNRMPNSTNKLILPSRAYSINSLITLILDNHSRPTDMRHLQPTKLRNRLAQWTTSVSSQILEVQHLHPVRRIRNTYPREQRAGRKRFLMTSQSMRDGNGGLLLSSAGCPAAGRVLLPNASSPWRTKRVVLPAFTASMTIFVWMMTATSTMLRRSRRTFAISSKHSVLAFVTA